VAVIRGEWETWRRTPYFANLKVMRAVLQTVREEVATAGGSLNAYVFLEDRIAFMAEGPDHGLAAALDRARDRSEAAFRASDQKALWGKRSDSDVTSSDRQTLLTGLRRLPIVAGVVSDLSEYPWTGGDWLFPAD